MRIGNFGALVAAQGVQRGGCVQEGRAGPDGWQRRNLRWHTERNLFGKGARWADS